MGKREDARKALREAKASQRCDKATSIKALFREAKAWLMMDKMDEQRRLEMAEKALLRAQALPGGADDRNVKGELKKIKAQMKAKRAKEARAFSAAYSKAMNSGADEEASGGGVGTKKTAVDVDMEAALQDAALLLADEEKKAAAEA